MKRKPKIQHRATGEMFEYGGRFYRAMLTEGEKNICKRCAFGNPKTNEDAKGCADHQCELDVDGVYYERVK